MPTPSMTINLIFRSEEERQAFRQFMQEYKEAEGIYYDYEAITDMARRHTHLRDEHARLRKQYAMLNQIYSDVCSRLSLALDKLEEGRKEFAA